MYRESPGQFVPDVMILTILTRFLENCKCYTKVFLVHVWVLFSSTHFFFSKYFTLRYVFS
jgi:hypothetical protein